MNRILRVGKGIDLLTQIIGAASLAFVLVLVSVQVVQRVTTGESWVWTGELARFAMVWSTFILMAHLLRTDGHLTIDLVDHLLSPEAEKVLVRVTDGLVALICLGLVWAGWGLLTAPFLGAAPATRLPLVLVYAIPFAGLLTTAAFATWQAIAGRPDSPRPGTAAGDTDNTKDA